MKRYEKNLNHAFFTNEGIISNNCFYKYNFFYEFKINYTDAIIICNSKTYLNEAIIEFRSYNKYINKFIYNDKIIKEFDPIQTITLPINIFHPSKVYIDKIKLDDCINRVESEEFVIPIATINNKVVILDGHTKLMALEKCDIKTVKVYEDTPSSFILDTLFITESQNINNIKGLQVLSHEEYQDIWIKFCEQYSLIK